MAAVLQPDIQDRQNNVSQYFNNNFLDLAKLI